MLREFLVLWQEVTVKWWMSGRLSTEAEGKRRAVRERKDERRRTSMREGERKAISMRESERGLEGYQCE